MGHDGLKHSYDLVVIGAGGHASVLIDVLKIQTDFKICLLDSDLSKAGQDILGCPILGGDELLPTLDVKYFLIGLGSVTSKQNELRKYFFSRACALEIEPYTLISEYAYVSVEASIGKGTVVFPKAIVNTNAILNENVIINTGAIIEHDCKIGSHTHVCPSATVLGNVIIDDECLIGANATILQGVTINQNATVGASSLILSDVARDETLYGVPAKSNSISR